MSTLLEYPLFLAMTLFALPASLILWMKGAGHTSESRNPTEHWLCIISWYASLTIALGLLVGAVDLFRTWALLSSGLALFGAGLLPFIRNRRQERLHVFRLLRATFRPALGAGLPRTITLTIAGSVTGIALVAPVTQYDTLMYHLPTVANWISTNSLDMFDQWFYISRYPFGWDMLSAESMLITGSDQYILWPNLLALFWLLLVVYHLSLAVQPDANRASIAAALFITCPLIPLSLLGMQADVPRTAAFLTGMYAVMRYDETGRPNDVILVVLNAGILIAAKMSGIIYLVPVLLALVVSAIRRSQAGDSLVEHKSVRASVSYGLLLTALLVSAWVGGFWYLRNFMEWGNPLGFVPVSVAGVEVFPVHGPVESFVSNSREGTLLRVFEPMDISHWAIVAREAARYFVLGLPFFAFGAIQIPICMARTGRLVHRGRFLLVSFLIPLTFFMYVNSPFSGSNEDLAWEFTPWMGWQMRYGLTWLALLAVATTACPWWPPRWFMKTLLGVSCAICVATLVSDLEEFMNLGLTRNTFGQELILLANDIWQNRASELAGALAFATVILGLYAAVRPVFVLGLPKFRRTVPARLGTAVAGLCMVSLFLLLSYTRIAHASLKYRDYEGIVHFWSERPNEKPFMGFADSHRAYYFFNPNWSNRVQYIPLYEDEAEWIHRLADYGVDYFAIGPAIGPVADGACKMRTLIEQGEHKGLFKRVSGVSLELEPFIYEVNQTSMQDSTL